MRIFIWLTAFTLVTILNSLSHAQGSAGQEAELEPGQEASEQSEGFPGGPQDSWVIIHAGTLIAEPGRKPRTEVSVIVKNDTIHAIEEGFVSAQYLAPEAINTDDVKIVDLSKSYVLPGLIDVHVHLEAREGSPFFGSSEAYTTLNIIKTTEATLAAGFTTVRDLGSDSDAIIAVAEAIEVGELQGPRILFAGRVIHVGGKAAANACHDPGTCRAAALAQINRGAKWLKIYGTCSGFQSCGGPTGHGLFFPEELDAIVDTARRHDVKVAMHAHANGGVRDALKAGVRSVEHATFSDQKSRKLFKQQGAFLVPTLSVLDQLSSPEDDLLNKDIKDLSPVQRVMRFALELHPKGVARAIKDGIKIAVGSDAGVAPHGDNATELVKLVDVGMTPAQALRAATVVNAELLAMEDKIGSISAGKYADIIAVDSNPLDNIEAVRTPSFVMADGKTIIQAGE